MTINSRFSLTTVAVAVSIILSAGTLALNARLRRENRDLRIMLENQSMVEAPQVGTYLKPLKGKDNKGRPEQIDFAALQNPVLAIVLSPACHYCQADLPTWKHLVEINKSTRFLLINLGQQDDTAFLSSLHLPPDALRITITPAEAASHSFQVTPTAIVVGPMGKIDWSWPGRLPDDQTAYLEHLLTNTNRSIVQ